MPCEIIRGDGAKRFLEVSVSILRDARKKRKGVRGIARDVTIRKEAGAHLSLGSDWTVAPFDPMINLHVALNRHKWSPDDPDQRLTLEECVLGYTRDAAYTEFMEDQKGQIKEGYLADLVLFSHNLFQVPPEERNNFV